MKMLIHALTILALLTQQISSVAWAFDKGETVCGLCLPGNLELGDRVSVGDKEWMIKEKTTIDGRTMYVGDEIGIGADSRLSDSPVGTSSMGESTGGSRDGNGGNGPGKIGGSDRFTGRDFQSFEDDEKASRSAREAIARKQRIIVDRINRETKADGDATDKDISRHAEALKSDIADATDLRANSPLYSVATRDPITSVAASVAAKAEYSDLTAYMAGWTFYDLQPYESDHAQVLEGLRRRLVNHPPRSPQQVDASRAAYTTLSEADQSYLADKDEEGDVLVGIAKILIDLATDFNPVTSVGKDSYRAYVGKDPITGEQLANWERVLAVGMVFLTVGTAGGSNFLSAPAKALGKVAHLSSAELASAVKLGNSLTDVRASEKFIKSTKDLLTDIRYLDPVRENTVLKEVRKYTQKAWAESRMMVAGNTRKTQNFVRVYSDDVDRVGSWVVDAKVIENKTPAEIEKLMALSSTPTKVVPVKLPKGSEVYTGFFSPNKFGGDVNSIQVFLPVPKATFFGEERAIGQIFRSAK